MFRTTKIRTTIATMAVTSLALIAASPASAIYRAPGTTPDDLPVAEQTASAGKGCTIDIKGPDGNVQSSIIYADGYSFKVKNTATGKTHTYTCKDGTWVETVSSKATADVGGTLVLVNAHKVGSALSDGTYTAAP